MHDGDRRLESGSAGYSTPRLRTDVVERQRLIAQLNEHPYRLVLMSAPAGFGKTTLALAWLQTRAEPIAWVSLNVLDNDPYSFFSQVASKLGRIDERYSAGLTKALEVRAPANVLSARLVEDLRLVDREITMVIDDYQYIESAEIHRLVGALPDMASTSFHLVILSRVDPPFPLARLRLNGEALEIRQRDLRFSTDETIALFEKTAGVSLDTHAAEALEQRTEGWAAGLQMTAISLRHESNVEAFVRNLAGSNLFVVDYLLEEVVQRQSPEMQQFLLRSSILIRFDTRLCRAVTEMEDTARLLEEAEAANLFLVQLDEPRGWYRYHRLFAELMSDRLRRLHPNEWERLNEIASVWFEQEGDLTSALHYAGLLTSHVRLLCLLDRHGATMLDRSEFAAFARWSERIPLQDAASFPRFLIECIWVRLLTERFSDIDSMLRLADASIENAGGGYSAEERNALRGTIATQRAYAHRLQERYDESLVVTRQALESTAADDVRNRGLLLFNLGRTAAFLGETREAREAFELAYACALQARTWYHVLGIPAYLASLVAQSESLNLGLERIEASVAFARERHLDDLPAFGFQQNQLGRFHLLRNDLNSAEAAFAMARERGTAGSVHSVMSNAIAGLARVFGARRDFDRAHEAMHELDVLAQTTYPLLYESNVGIERAVLALAEDDATYLDVWVGERSTSIGGGFNVERETAHVILMQVLLRKRAWEGAEEVIDWLETQSGSRGRRLTELIARIGRAIMDFERHGSDAGVRSMGGLLAEVAAQHVIRPILDFGAPARRLIVEALSMPLPSAAARFGAELLEADQASLTTAVPVFRQALSAPLTEREQEVLYYLSSDLSYQGIADALYVSHDTVKTHVRHVYAKLNVSNRVAAVAHAREAGFALFASAGD